MVHTSQPKHCIGDWMNIGHAIHVWEGSGDRDNFEIEGYIPDDRMAFGYIVLFLQICLGALFYRSKFDLSQSSTTNASSTYNFYTSMAVLTFIGFGYRLSFLKACGLGAVGFTMFIISLGVEWAMVCESFAATHSFEINFATMLNGLAAVVAVLASYAGLIGKVNPLQILVVTVMEIFAYTLNKVYFLQLHSNSPFIVDAGGSISVHVFGAYFGMAACAVVGKPLRNKLKNSLYYSDIFSFLGTVFLWLYFPAFVSGRLPSGPEQNTALINTVLCLLASTTTTFALTVLIEGGMFSTLPIQTATISGGVAIGSSAPFLGPFGAIVVGMIAGIISTTALIPSFLTQIDSGGMHSLHGVAGLLGGVVSILVPLIHSGTGLNALHQALGLLGTLFVAVKAGAFCGFVLRFIDTPQIFILTYHSSPGVEASVLLEPEFFTDESYWSCAEDCPRTIEEFASIGFDAIAQYPQVHEASTEDGEQRVRRSGRRQSTFKG
eukprot:TRINITY_DN51668_c0_g1_i1.p1 TRINITY_DN51668_c0_g1~~TRINITY_DN51668_c0_g1_i1.p1  ORF type:complete len:492 (+),score=42.34 TRINITY_DN51668_c0_g1_i1:135-1610(+)